MNNNSERKYLNFLILFHEPNDGKSIVAALRHTLSLLGIVGFFPHCVRHLIRRRLKRYKFELRKKGSARQCGTSSFVISHPILNWGLPGFLGFSFHFQRLSEFRPF